jgi:pimeloyl-ACP methyl ester carboxylesterase
VFGSSIGALIGLDLIARHPEQVRLLVAHEPPAWELLPEDERDRATRAVEDAEITFQREGVVPAFKKAWHLRRLTTLIASPMRCWRRQRRRGRPISRFSLCTTHRLFSAIGSMFPR